MPDAKFILKEPKSKDDTLIYMFFNFKSLRLKYSTGEKINPKHWNSEKQRVRETAAFKQHPEFNARLKKLDNAVNNAYRRLMNDDVIITSDLLKEELDKELGKKQVIKIRGLIEWIESEIEIMKMNKKHGSIQVYNALVQHLKGFSKSRKYKLTFETINLQFYDQFKDYLLNEKGLLTNTCGKQISTLRTFLNLATEKKVNTNMEYKNRLFKSMNEEINHIHLTKEEIDEIYKLDLGKKNYLDRVRDVFLIGCYTGLRFSDFTQLKPENLEKKKEGLFFNVTTYKTKERVVVPVHPRVKKIWDKYKGELPRAISNQKMNEYLKELGEEAKINQNIIVKKTSGKRVVENIYPKFKLISTHTARRSFATNTFLSGMPAISIMKFTGHKTESSFMKYIKVSQEANAIRMMNHPFFK